MKKVVNSIFAILIAFASFSSAHCEAADASTQPAAEPALLRRDVEVVGKKIAYLVAEPTEPTAPKDRWMLVFLHGAGGSLKGYNLSRPPYAKIRQALRDNGAYTVVPELGRLHFMGDEAKTNLTAVIDKVRTDYQIDPKHVHLMGTSMGAGSSLAYAVNRPERVRSVCAIMPMTDFAEWVKQAPKYTDALKAAFGGTVDQNRDVYDANSAFKRPDALAKIPVMLIHGAADTTVPVSQSEKLAALLKGKGYPCTLIRVEGGAHKDEIVADVQDQIVQFLLAANRDGAGKQKTVGN